MLLAAATLTLASPCPATATCFDAERVLVVAADPARAEAIFHTAVDAQALFESRFGIQAAPIAVVEDIETFPGVSAELRAAGYRVKPWISPSAMRRALESQVRPALEQAMAGAPQAAIDARVESVLNDRVDQNEKVRHQDAIIAHELGHLWLIEGIDWPEVDTGDARAYGAPAAPDWLDEAFAVALETESLTEERRDFFCSERPADLPRRISEFLTMEHPLLAAASAAADARARALEAAAAGDGGQDGPQIMVMTGDSLGADEDAGLSATMFYGLSRVMVDFADATTGGVEVYTALASDVADGGSQESWLAGQGFGWPRDIEGLSQAVTQFAEAGCDA